MKSSGFSIDDILSKDTKRTKYFITPICCRKGIKVYFLRIFFLVFAKCIIRHHWVIFWLNASGKPIKSLKTLISWHTIYKKITLSCGRSLSYRTQSIDLQSNLIVWFIYDRELRHVRIKTKIFRQDASDWALML